MLQQILIQYRNFIKKKKIHLLLIDGGNYSTISHLKSIILIQTMRTSKYSVLIVSLPPGCDCEECSIDGDSLAIVSNNNSSAHEALKKIQNLLAFTIIKVIKCNPCPYNDIYIKTLRKLHIRAFSFTSCKTCSG